MMLIVMQRKKFLMPGMCLIQPDRPFYGCEEAAPLCNKRTLLKLVAWEFTGSPHHFYMFNNAGLDGRSETRDLQHH
jgi:hypothetical protein